MEGKVNIDVKEFETLLKKEIMLDILLDNIYSNSKLSYARDELVTPYVNDSILKTIDPKRYEGKLNELKIKEEENKNE